MKAIRKIWLGTLMASCVLAAAVLRATPVEVLEQESNFQNIQVLTVMTDREIQQTMQGWSEQFGVTCFECHVQGDFASDELDRKRIARQMAAMVLELDKTPFFVESGWRADCYMCHKGSFDTEMSP